MLVLPEAVSLRGTAPAVRPAGGRDRADACRAEAKTLRAANAPSLGSARRPDDHVELACSRAAGEGIRRDAELFCEAQCECIAAGREVHARLRVIEAARPPDLLDRVAERLDVARSLTR